MAESANPNALADWLAHLETLHPKSIDLGLQRIHTVAVRLGVVPTSRRTITVAGTNGKGSCVATLQALLIASGHSVGVYTSPHLIAFNERIAIGGIPVTDQQILTAFAAIESAREEITLSYFEFATLAALWLFEQHSVDWQILEVGLGGQLDAVNIVDADACVITSIGTDHTEWLGETRELIAPEKAGVARPNCPAIVAETDLPSTLLPTLESIGAEVWLRNREWVVTPSHVQIAERKLPLPAVPGLQAGNLAAAIVVLTVLDITLEPQLILDTFQSLVVPGRQQRIPLGASEWWFDVAHNNESVAVLAAALSENPSSGRVHAIFGAMADKPLRDMLSSMSGHIDEWHLPAAPEVSRAAHPEDLAGLLGEAPAMIYPNAGAAFNRVTEVLNPGDRVIVFGSFIVVGAQLALVRSHPAYLETPAQ